MVSKIDLEATEKEIYSVAVRIHGVDKEDLEMFPELYIDLLHSIEQEISRAKREQYLKSLVPV
jgi:hypothetical protein